MNHLPLRLLTGTLALLVLSCDLNKEDAFTVVEGKVMNPYLGQPVAGVSIVAYRVLNSWSGPFIDSLTAAETDAAGYYQLSFDASKSARYEVRMRSTNVYDVTNGFDGYAEAERGTANHLNFSVTPYKTVTLDVNSSKGGKTDISFGYFTNDPGNWVGGTIFYDTLKAHQDFHFLQTIRVVPNRTYRFNRTTANRYKVPNTYYYDFRDYASTFIDRTVGYNDTTVITFR
ncbi:hypothetical protein [Hymenobacter sp. GOD-10R]|uniref:hypothetical protein n=1 Tax=Hymenobacter sp. GOD-10R TaxID=3093922 RepID=UPI002D78D986|nr:hypothetical protein [Hymenobacter sp. GOD-10R]WRQ26993.1 hypothetical protein SD425_18130 [Hymenobacter sp. GOD-10R]